MARQIMHSTPERSASQCHISHFLNFEEIPARCRQQLESLAARVVETPFVLQWPEALTELKHESLHPRTHTQAMTPEASLAAIWDAHVWLQLVQRFECGAVAAETVENGPMRSGISSVKAESQARGPAQQIKTRSQSPVQSLEQALDSLFTGHPLNAAKAAFKLLDLPSQGGGATREQGPSSGLLFLYGLTAALASATETLPGSWEKKTVRVMRSPRPEVSQSFASTMRTLSIALRFSSTVFDALERQRGKIQSLFDEPQTTREPLCALESVVRSYLAQTYHLKESPHGGTAARQPTRRQIAHQAGSHIGRSEVPYPLFHWLFTSVSQAHEGGSKEPHWLQDLSGLEVAFGIKSPSGTSTTKLQLNATRQAPLKPKLLWSLNFEASEGGWEILPLERTPVRGIYAQPKFVPLSRLMLPGKAKAYDLSLADKELLAHARQGTFSVGLKSAWRIPWEDALPVLTAHDGLVRLISGVWQPQRIQFEKPILLLTQHGTEVTFDLLGVQDTPGRLWWHASPGLVCVAKLDPGLLKALAKLLAFKAPAADATNTRLIELLDTLARDFQLGAELPEEIRSFGILTAERSPLPITVRFETVFDANAPHDTRSLRKRMGSKSTFSTTKEPAGESARESAGESALPSSCLFSATLAVHAPVLGNGASIGDGLALTLGSPPRSFLRMDAQGKTSWHTRDLQAELKANKDFADELERARTPLHVQDADNLMAPLTPLTPLTQLTHIVDSWDALSHMLEWLSEKPDTYTVEWPEKDGLKCTFLSSIQLQVGEGQGVGEWFALGAESARILARAGLSLQSLLAKMGSGNEGFVTLDDGGLLALSQRVRALLGDMVALGAGEMGSTKNGARAQAKRAIQAVLAAAYPESIVAEGAAASGAEVKVALSAESEIHPRILERLREYQREGVRWIAARWEKGLGCCLADDMGLGKTFQAIVALERVPLSQPCLVVCPTSVVGNWCVEVKEFAHCRQALPYPTSGREGFLAGLKGPEVVVVSYQALLMNAQAFTSRAWGALVLDEAQMIKNSGAKRTEAIADVPALRKLALSGTPVENRVEEIHSLLDVLNPGLLGDEASFRRRFGGGYSSNVAPAARKSLARILKPFLLRRTRAQVLTDLPDRVEDTRLLAMTDAHRLQYESYRIQALDFLDTSGLRSKDRFEAFTWLLRLRQICSHPRNILSAQMPFQGSTAKDDELGALLAEKAAEGKKVLVFSQFLATLDNAFAIAADVGLKPELFRGDTPSAKRDAIARRFQAGHTDVLCMSLRAGGMGLNLTRADCVVHFDPWWNPALELQATSRAHRSGRTEVVEVVRLCYADTVEERMLAMHQEKRTLSEDLLDGASLESGVSLDDLRRLFSSE